MCRCGYCRVAHTYPTTTVPGVIYSDTLWISYFAWIASLSAEQPHCSLRCHQFVHRIHTWNVSFDNTCRRLNAALL